MLEGSVYDDSLYGSNFQVIWFGWFADYADPENWLPEFFAPDGGLNLINYDNAEVADLLEEAASELVEERRLALYDAAHRIIIEDQAITPIYHPERNYLVKAHVAGIVTTVLDAEPGDWFVPSVRILDTGSAPPASDPN